jgi:hypothetical protein
MISLIDEQLQRESRAAIGTRCGSAMSDAAKVSCEAGIRASISERGTVVR